MKTGIHLGDMRELIKQVEDESIDCILTDPPYKFERHGRGFCERREYMKDGFKKIGIDKDLNIYTEDFWQEVERVSKKVNWLLFCNKAQLPDLINYATSKGYSFELLVFLKTAPTPLTNNQWLPDKEYAVHIFHKIEVLGDYKTKKSFFIDSNFKDTGIDHPTPKPLKVIEGIMRNITKEGDLVLDMFIGSGTTALACERLNRRYIGFEIDEHFYNIAKRRIEEVRGNVGLFKGAV